MDMFKHSTRGSIGLLTYDSITNENVQVTNELITPLHFKYNKERLYGIDFDLKQDHISNRSFDLILNDCMGRIKDLENLEKSNQNIFDIHRTIQQDLFEHIQRNPTYNRSISFIFTKHVDYSCPLENKFDNFHKRFVSLLGDKIYNLDQGQDRKDIFRAMLIAYKTEVDPLIIDKLYHLHHIEGITLNTHFLLI
jgi:hemerythrin